jgi:hypothetical protein
VTRTERARAPTSAGGPGTQAASGTRPRAEQPLASTCKDGTAEGHWPQAAPTGACESAPNLGTSTLGRRRARPDDGSSCFVSGPTTSLLNRPPGGPALPPSPGPVAARPQGPGPSSGCLVVSESDAGQFGDFAKLARSVTPTPPVALGRCGPRLPTRPEWQQTEHGGPHSPKPENRNPGSTLTSS